PGAVRQIPGEPAGDREPRHDRAARRVVPADGGLLGGVLGPGGVAGPAAGAAGGGLERQPGRGGGGPGRGGGGEGGGAPAGGGGRAVRGGGGGGEGGAAAAGGVAREGGGTGPRGDGTPAAAGRPGWPDRVPGVPRRCAVQLPVVFGRRAAAVVGHDRAGVRPAGRPAAAAPAGRGPAAPAAGRGAGVTRGAPPGTPDGVPLAGLGDLACGADLAGPAGVGAVFAG